MSFICRAFHAAKATIPLVLIAMIASCTGSLSGGKDRTDGGIDPDTTFAADCGASCRNDSTGASDGRGEGHATADAPSVARDEFFTIGVMPDTQYLVNDDGECKSKGLRDMFSFFVDRQSELKLQVVAHVGDMTQGTQEGKVDEEWGHVQEQWDRFMNGHDVLQRSNIPFIPARGNHDSRRGFKKNFPVSDFEGLHIFGGRRDELWNAYYLFSAAGKDFIILVVDFRRPSDAAVHGWAHGVLRKHRDRIAIVVTHDFRGLEDAVIKKNDNVYMVIMGHTPRDTHYTQKSLKKMTQHLFVFDYQDVKKHWNSHDCAGAVVKYFTFRPSQNKVEMRTYSVYQNEHLTRRDCHNNAGNGSYLCQEFDFAFDRN